MNHFKSRINVAGFTLIELLLVVTIIALLASMMLPSLRRARNRARDVNCLSQVRQIAIAMSMYHEDWEEKYFWRGASQDIDGMDWYVYGGRETGNKFLGQAGLFNRFEPRPLNPYVHSKIGLFHCPFDSQPWSWSSWAGINYSHFDLVGNSYAFNATGYPSLPVYGLAGVRLPAVRIPASTAVFYDTTLNKAPFNWHDGTLANFAFADGHCETSQMPGYDGDRGIYFEP